MKSGWLVVAEEEDVSCADVGLNAKLRDIMNQIEEGKGWRYTEQQAETLGKLVDRLIAQAKAENKSESAEQKGFFQFLFESVGIF